MDLVEWTEAQRMGELMAARRKQALFRLSIAGAFVVDRARTHAHRGADRQRDDPSDRRLCRRRHGWSRGETDRSVTPI